MCEQDSKIGSLVRFFQPQLNPKFDPYAGASRHPGAPGTTVPDSTPPMLPSRFQQYGAPAIRGASYGAMAAPGPTRGLAAPGFAQQFFTGLGAATQGELARRQNEQALQMQQENALLNAAHIRQQIAQSQAGIEAQKQNMTLAEAAEKRAAEEHQRKLGLYDTQRKFLLGDEGESQPQDALNPPAPPAPMGLVPELQGKVPMATAAPAKGAPINIDPLVKNLGLDPEKLTDYDKASLRSSAAADITSQNGGFAHTNNTANGIRVRQSIEANRQTNEALPKVIFNSHLQDIIGDKRTLASATPKEKLEAAKRTMLDQSIPGAIRGAIMAGRGVQQVLDANGNATFATNAQLGSADAANALLRELGVNLPSTGGGNKAGAGNGGPNYSPLTTAAKSMGRFVQIDNIREAMKEFEPLVDVLGKPDERTRIAATLAPLGKNPTKEAVLDYLVKGEVKKNFTPEENNFFATIARLQAEAIGLRQALGQAGYSDEQRRIDLNLIPDPISDTPAVARSKMKQLSQIINKVETGIPGIAGRPKAKGDTGGATPPAGAKVIELKDF